MTSSRSARTDLCLVAGFGIYKAASSTGYLSAMGTVPANLGFMSQPPFMLAVCLAEAAVALAIATAARTGRRPVGRTTYVGYALLVFASVLGCIAGLFDTGGLASVPLGLLKGAGGIVVSIAWIVLFVTRESLQHPTGILGTFVIGGALGFILSFLTVGNPFGQFGVVALYAVSWVCMHVTATVGQTSDSAAAKDGQTVAAVPPRPEAQGILRFGSPQGRGLLSAWLCLLVCHFVVGMANSAVFGSSFASNMAEVDTNICLLLAVAILAVVFRVTRQAPEPEAIYKAAMPVLLAVFTLAALATDSFGSAMSYAMITCYEAIAVAYTVYLIAFLRPKTYEPTYVLGITSGVSSLTLLVGLLLGAAIDTVSDSHGIPLFTLLAFVAIYPLGSALLFIQRNRAQNGPHAAKTAESALDGAPGNAGTGPHKGFALSDIEDFHAARIRDFANSFGLTRRETEVCSELTRGHTVKSIAETLGISENTAWTHIRNVYAKCSVKTKQALIDKFENSSDGKI